MRRSRGAKSSRDSCSTSAAILIVVMGVRSSWLTSLTKRCCRVERLSSSRILCCSCAAIRFMDFASEARSSVPLTLSRTSNSPDASFSAAWLALRTGRTTWTVTR